MKCRRDIKIAKKIADFEYILGHFFIALEDWKEMINMPKPNLDWTLEKYNRFL